VDVAPTHTPRVFYAGLFRRRHKKMNLGSFYYYQKMQSLPDAVLETLATVAYSRCKECFEFMKESTMKYDPPPEFIGEWYAKVRPWVYLFVDLNNEWRRRFGVDFW
jgi:hypothetical protein